MVARTGYIASDFASGAMGGGSLLWTSGRPSYFVISGWKQSGANTGARAENQPQSEPYEARGGHVARSFSADYYHRIHATPKRIDVGNLANAQTRTLEIWNAHLTPVTLDDVSAENQDSLGFPVVPAVFGGLESKTYSVTIPLEGAPTINALFTMTFATGEVATLTVTGRRILVFGFPPNWGERVLDKLEWLTDVMEAWDGTEQRVKLRGAPRREYQFTALVSGAEEQAKLDSLLYGWGGRVFCVPLWHDAALVEAAIPAGAVSISVPTDSREFAPGYMAVLWRDAMTAEVVEVQSATGGVVTLARPTESAWAAGTRLIPALLARVRTADQDQYCANVLDHFSAFTIIDQPAITAAPEASTYQGVQVLTREHNFDGPASRQWSRKWGILDNGVTLRTWFDRSGFPYLARSLDFLLIGRSDIAAFKGWLSSLSGRLGAFWLPVRETIWEPSRSVGANSTLFYIKTAGYSSLLKGQDNRDTIILRHVNGAAYFRTVTDAQVDLAGGDEVLTLDTAIPVSHAPGDWTLVAPLERVRLDSDSVEISYESAEVAAVSITVKGIRQ